MTAPASKYLASGRLATLTFGGQLLEPWRAERLTNGEVSLSSTQTSQMTFDMPDPDLALVAANTFVRQTPVEYGGLQLEVAARELTSDASYGSKLTLTCRARGVQALRRDTGHHVWGQVSYSALALALAAQVGMEALVQDSPVVDGGIERKADPNTTPESSWDVLTRGARVCGFWLFEDSGVLCFGKPSWLFARRPHVTLEYRNGTAKTTTPGLLASPTFRESDDDANGTTGSVSLTLAAAERIGIGYGIAVYGMGPFTRGFLTTGVDLVLDESRPSSVAFADVIDPDPQTAG